ncbi:mitochondrial resolvase ydc2 [Diplodia corticola]|uniref:Mitochondrial resolvase ydc2 n=1 Tax=Diplodia corticola TaxID=236234 RepID=A0A1J9R109_9PEZI|nr:mitochondrial resolvase ydc2 [Diplodia corticola]OJD35078.1 mitochondrial resolvase ydc2 [Diplodia corticola]
MSKKVQGAITAPQLRTLLARIGSGVGGNKPELAERLQSDLNVAKLQHGSKPGRILSVDMGIRNMACCVCDVSIQQPKKNSPTGSPRVKLNVLAWEPISVSDLAQQEEEQASSADPAARLSSQLTQTAKESFRPSILSRAAYALLKRKLLPYAPQTILIEQQRYRTTSSAAIQEWTYHVNMLEGMIWAILETLRQEETSARLPTAVLRAPSFPSAFPVSPKRVATFWTDNSELGRAILSETAASTAALKRPSSRSRSTASKAGEGVEDDAAAEGEEGVEDGMSKPKKLSKSKIEKRVKIKLVEQWLLANSSGSASARRDCDVQLSFDTAEVRGMRDVFLSRLSKAGKRTGGGSRKKRAKDASEAPAPSVASLSPPVDPKKLDDLADCLLQAAAWAQWEGNRRAMLGLDEKTLKEVAEASA